MCLFAMVTVKVRLFTCGFVHIPHVIGSSLTLRYFVILVRFTVEPRLSGPQLSGTSIIQIAIS